MPNANEGTVTAGADTAAPDVASDPLPGFAEAMSVAGDPQAAGSGHPAEAEAVDGNATETAPEAKSDTPAKESDAAADKPDPTKDVNFDGFSDKNKATWERLLKAGHATAEEVEEARKGYLRQDYFSRRTAEHNRAVEAWEAEKSALKADIDLLSQIRADDKKHAVWLSLIKNGFPAEASAEGDDLIDAKKAAEIAKREFDERERARADSAAKDRQRWEQKKEALEGKVKDVIAELGITQEQLNGYFVGIRAKVPAGADPILHFSPEDLAERVRTAHEVATAKAEAASLREQLSQTTSKRVQTSKQSFTPARRVSESAVMDPLKQTERDLNIAPDWGNVAGFGFRDGR